MRCEDCRETISARLDGETGPSEPRQAAVTHLAHESAAWSFALGVGFLWVACGGRARGLVPVVAVFVGGLALLSAADVLAGTVGAHRLTTHLVAVFGLFALLALQRSAPRDDGGRGGSRRDEPTQPVGDGPWSPVAGIPHDPAA